MAELLSEEAVVRLLAGVPGWERVGSAIRREIAFPGFMEAVAFVNRVAAVAERLDHHPDIDVRWRRVVLVLTTHSAGGLTALDFTAAVAMDAVISPPAPDATAGAGP